MHTLTTGMTVHVSASTKMRRPILVTLLVALQFTGKTAVSTTSALVLEQVGLYIEPFLGEAPVVPRPYVVHPCHLTIAFTNALHARRCHVPQSLVSLIFQAVTLQVV